FRILRRGFRRKLVMRRRRRRIDDRIFDHDLRSLGRFFIRIEQIFYHLVFPFILPLFSLPSRKSTRAAYPELRDSSPACYEFRIDKARKRPAESFCWQRFAPSANAA